MITAEKNRRRGKTNSVKASIDEHIEWLEQQLKLKKLNHNLNRRSPSTKTESRN
ncbi:hypothetical protein [Myxosarcina sp. GI1(2024)]